MSEALEDHTGTVSIGGRNITNLRFTDDINRIAGKEAELANLVRQLDRAPQDMEWRSVQIPPQKKTDGKQQQHHHCKYLISGPETRNSAAVQIPWRNNL